MAIWIRIGIVVTAMAIATPAMIVALKYYPEMRFQKVVISVLGAGVGITLGVAVLIGEEEASGASVLFVFAITILVAVTYVIFIPMVKRILAFGERLHGQR